MKLVDGLFRGFRLQPEGSVAGAKADLSRRSDASVDAAVDDRRRAAVTSSLPEAFTRLGFPGYFRVELSLAKLLGVVLLLAPVPARLEEWAYAYAGFAITLGSALIAHLSVGDGPEAWGWAAGTGVFWGLSYFLWHRLEAMPASA